MTATHIEEKKQIFFGNFLIFLLFSSLHLGSMFFINVGIKIRPTEILVLISLFFLLTINKFRLTTDKHTIILVVLIYAFFLLEVLDAVLRDLPENIVRGMAILRNGALIFLLSQVSYDYKKLGRWIVFSGVFFSIVAIIGYVIATLNLSNIISNPALWESEIFYTLEGRLIRLAGLIGDPNLFFLVNLLPLILSIHIIHEKKSTLPILSFIVLLTALILTFSRTGIIILGLYFLIKVLQKYSFKKIVRIIVITLTLMIASDYILAIFHVPGPYTIFISRFKGSLENITKGGDRLHYWRTAWEGFYDSPLLGKGGKYTYRNVREQRALKIIGLGSHNDFLEILSSHGLVGFSLMLLIYLYIMIFIRSRYKLFKENYIFTTGCQVFFLMLLISLFHSLYYTPYIWYYVALIFSARENYNENINNHRLS